MSDQPSLFDQIDAPARRRDPYSSKQAASRSHLKARSQARRILAQLSHYEDGATTRELQRALFDPADTAWNKVPTRLLDLKRKGLARRLDETRPDEDGQHFLTYQITAAGHDILDETYPHEGWNIT